MPKYLVEASYTAEGAKGIIKAGGSARRKSVEDLLATFNGKLEAFYFAFGERDAVIILDAPDNTTVAAISLAVAASGAVRTRTTVLLTPEEIDQAAKKQIAFRPPGQ
jgi:uncharacterized protein with GYD domain